MLTTHTSRSVASFVVATRVGVALACGMAGIGALALTATCAVAGAEHGQPWSGPLLSRSNAHVPPGFTGLTTDRQSAAELLDVSEAIITALPLTGDLAIDAVLTRIEVFTPDAQIVVAGDDGEHLIDAPPVACFRGTAVGHDDSTVFISVSPWWIYGYVTVDDRMYIISTGPAVDPRDPVVYDTAAISAEDLAIVIPPCQTDTSGLLAKAASMRQGGDGTSTRAGPCRVAKVAFESDYELTHIFGDDPVKSTAYIATLTAAMNDIYIRDVNTRILTPYVRVWATAADPWVTTDSGAALDEFRAYWVSKMLFVQRNLAHFVSGRGLGGGVAWVGVMCNSQYGFAMSGNLAGSFPYPLQDNRGTNWDPYVVAHEMGHNFGTGHTHDSYTPPVDTCGNGSCAGFLLKGTIMSYCHLCLGGVQNIKLQFGTRVSDRILTYLDLESPCELADAPKFTKHPSDTTVNLHATAKFTPAVSGPGTLSYQWFHDDVAVPGATTQQLTITDVGPEDIGAYKLHVTNECTESWSNPASLFVRCPADFDGSLFVDNEDFNAFVAAFTAGAMTADFDKSGFVDIEDFSAFVAAYEGGC